MWICFSPVCLPHTPKTTMSFSPIYTPGGIFRVVVVRLFPIPTRTIFNTINVKERFMTDFRMLGHLAVPVVLAAGGVALGAFAAPAVGIGALACMAVGGVAGAFAGTAHCVGRFFLPWGHAGEASYPSLKGYAEASKLTAQVVGNWTVGGAKYLFNKAAHTAADAAAAPAPVDHPRHGPSRNAYK
jgi:hypothetical protein